MDEFRGWPQVGSTVQRWIMLALGALALGAILVGHGPAWGAPRAHSSDECAVFADLALMASSASKRGVARATIDAMAGDIYMIRSPRVAAIATATVDAAVVFAASGGEPKDFALLVLRTCTERAGDMDSILGVNL